MNWPVQTQLMAHDILWRVHTKCQYIKTLYRDDRGMDVLLYIIMWYNITLQRNNFHHFGKSWGFTVGCDDVEIVVYTHTHTHTHKNTHTNTHTQTHTHIHTHTHTYTHIHTHTHTIKVFNDLCIDCEIRLLDLKVVFHDFIKFKSSIPYYLKINNCVNSNVSLTPLSVNSVNSYLVSSTFCRLVVRERGRY